MGDRGGRRSAFRSLEGGTALLDGIRTAIDDHAARVASDAKSAKKNDAKKKSGNGKRKNKNGNNSGKKKRGDVDSTQRSFELSRSD